jgi:hypothetical protein
LNNLRTFFLSQLQQILHLLGRRHDAGHKEISNSFQYGAAIHAHIKALVDDFTNERHRLGSLMG